MKNAVAITDEFEFQVENEPELNVAVEKPCQNGCTAQQISHRFFEAGVVWSERRPDELSSASTRPKQAAETLGRFDIGIGISDQLVSQALANATRGRTSRFVNRPPRTARFRGKAFAEP